MQLSITPPLSPVTVGAAQIIEAPSSSNIAASFTMTPEPSPMSLRMETGESSRGANISSIARRITFEDDDVELPNNVEEVMETETTIEQSNGDNC